MPAIVAPTPNSTNSAIKQVSRNTLNQLIGKLSDNSSTQSSNLVTALNAVAAAINAKPSA